MLNNPEIAIDSSDTPDKSLLRTPEEEGRISAEKNSPKYEYTLKNGDSEIKVYGYRHTYNLDDVADMVQELEQMQPSLVLVEGQADERSKDIPEGAGEEDILRQNGEQTFIAWKAGLMGGEVKSWDIPTRQQMDLIKEKHSPDAIIGWIIGQGTKHVQDSGRPQTPEALREIIQIGYGSLAELSDKFGLDLSDENLQRISQKYTGKPILDITPEDAENLATPRKEGETNNVIRDMNNLRNEHAIDVINEAKEARRKILVIAGSSHAVVWEPVLRQMFPVGHSESTNGGPKNPADRRDSRVRD